MGWPNNTSKYCILMLVVYTLPHQNFLMGRPDVSGKHTNVTTITILNVSTNILMYY